MKKLLLLAAVCLTSLSASAQLSTAQYANSATGTTLNTLTKTVVNGGVPQAQIAATTDTQGVIGITTDGAGTTGKPTITYAGIAPCVFDNTTVGNDFVQIASGTAGNCHDAGATRPTSGQIIGLVAQTGGSAGTYNVMLDKSIYPSSASSTGSLFGDGSDGAVTADGAATVTCLGAPAANVYTMTRDCYFTTLVLNSGITIRTTGYRVFASTSLTNSGTISYSATNGGAGGNATGTNKSTGGAAGSNSSTLGTGSILAPLVAKAGVTGGSGGTGVGSAGTNGTAGTTTGVAVISTAGNAGVAGGNGGASGASGGNNAGGTGGTAGAGGTTTLAKSTPHEFGRALVLADAFGNGYQSMAGNGGAGSGAAGGGDATNAGGGGGGSGGGGGNGGYLVLSSPTITLNVASVVTVAGGNGGNGGNGGTPTVGNCGGGGGGAGGDGGNGGLIVRIFSTLTNNGTDTVSGGTGGTGGTLGTGVGTGTNGTAGTTGTNGSSGAVFDLQLH